ncbi:MAG: N-acetylmuramoyl-L-alanine amidase [Akkermansia sp.]|nr:N-acetylmuramoyl-L-alanine amidase [Akkermansia sp.]
MRIRRAGGSSLVLSVWVAAASCAWANAANEAANAAEQASPPPPAVNVADAPVAGAGNWHVREVDGVEYLPLEDLRSFYKLMSLQPKGRRVAGQRIVGNGELELRFGPEPRELRIQNMLFLLTHPVQEDASGDLLVSKLDVLSVIEPVLRPTYIANRSALRTVVIDPGHGGHDVGTVSPFAREADVTLLVAKKLGAELTKRGYEVSYTQNQNQYLSPQARVDKANAAPAAILLSLHLNSGRSDMKGVQTYTIAPADKGDKILPGHPYVPASTALAMALQSSLVQHTEAEDGGCRRARYSPLNSVTCPAVTVEMGFATHPEEGARLSSDEYQMKLADALADGVDAFARVMNPATVLQVQKAPEVEPPAEPVKVAPAPAKKEAAPRPVRQKTAPKWARRAKAPVRRAKPVKRSNNRRRR